MCARVVGASGAWRRLPGRRAKEVLRNRGGERGEDRDGFGPVGRHLFVMRWSKSWSRQNFFEFGEMTAFSAASTDTGIGRRGQSFSR